MESWCKQTILEEEQEATEEVGVSVENGGERRRAEETHTANADKRRKLDWSGAEVKKVTKLANLVCRKYFVSQKIFGYITYNP